MNMDFNKLADELDKAADIAMSEGNAVDGSNDPGSLVAGIGHFSSSATLRTVAQAIRSALERA